VTYLLHPVGHVESSLAKPTDAPRQGDEGAVLRVHPRDDDSRSALGVFATRSSGRPNPIGLHAVRVLAIDGARVHVADLEAIDGTPLLDVKPVLGPVNER
jgi:tRNA (Thr-GGU) A37 N-methylase